MCDRQNKHRDAILFRNRVTVSGCGDASILFAHGFGCDQRMWRHVVPAFEADYRVILMDHVGSGRSDRNAYRVDKYDSLQGYADDLIEVLLALAASNVVFVGHSVSAMIGMLAWLKCPELFRCLVMLGPSPRYLNDVDYEGGFTSADMDELLALLELNHMKWSKQVAPMIMGNAERPEFAQELVDSFCDMDPFIARHFSRVAFLSDLRSRLPHCLAPCLILQCSRDLIAPIGVGQYLHRSLKNGELVILAATGHCPHVSAPEETTAAIRNYLSKLDAKTQE
jgi:sigma-B regulation protein RsbQ